VSGGGSSRKVGVIVSVWARLPSNTVAGFPEDSLVSLIRLFVIPSFSFFLPSFSAGITSLENFDCVRVCTYVPALCVHRFASRVIIVTGETPLTRALRLEIVRDTGSTTDEARSSQSIAIDEGSIGDSRDPN